jgi:hypothetical protein
MILSRADLRQASVIHAEAPFGAVGLTSDVVVLRSAFCVFDRHLFEGSVIESLTSDRTRRTICVVSGRRPAGGRFDSWW